MVCKQGKELERYRLEQKTEYDLEMLREIGHCQVGENYSLHFDGREPGQRPYCLLDFFAACANQFHGDPQKYLVIMDESHVSLPQVGGMYHGDKSRKGEPHQPRVPLTNSSGQSPAQTP